jgi:hypothetical protein
MAGTCRRAITRFAIVLLLGLAAPSVSAQGLRPVIFTPASPVAGETIEVAFDTNICESIADLPNQVDLVPTGTNIDVIVDGNVANDIILCFQRPARARFVLGALPPGGYTVRIVIRSEFPPFALFPPSASGSIVVAAAPIPAFSGLNLGILAMLTLVFGLFDIASRKTAAFTLAGVALFNLAAVHSEVRAQAADAKPVYVVLSAAPTAPTPAMVVEGWNFSAGASPPLFGLNASQTAELAYLLPVRASGAFLSFLLANPNSPRARLERTIIVYYVPSANVPAAITSLQGDPHVLSASEPVSFDFGLPPAASATLPASTTGGTQSWVNAMQFPGAWALAGGWGLVGLLDNGLAISHPDLISVNASNALTGGNFLPAYALDNGRYIGQSFPLETGIVDFNVDERQPFSVAPLGSACDTNNDGFIVADIAGHGTHTAGLVGANHTNNDGTVGACRNCGIASVKISRDSCNIATGVVFPGINTTSIPQGITYLVDNGVQVINGSFGTQVAQAPNCTLPAFQLTPECEALRYASEAGVVVVASSGNNKATLNWPARDPKVVAIGGLNEDNLSFWLNRSDLAGAVNNCPVISNAPLNAECGSNFSQSTTEPKQGLVAQARNVFSLTYPGVNWNPTIQCGDSYGSALGDGRGLCTGTSMSAPMISGLAGILRSVNPLVMPGDPETVGDPLGIRDALIGGGAPPGLNAWDQQFGYGRVNAAGSVGAMLGVARGITMRNRLTPLFSLYSTPRTDFAYTTVPQVAVALMTKGLSGGQGLIDGRQNNGDWLPQGAVVRGYPAFPGVGPPGIPRADIFVLTTENRVDLAHPPLAPLYWLDRIRSFPVGCTSGAGCETTNRDFLLMTASTEVTTALNDGYSYRGLQGYVYQRCTPEPTCIPPGAERLYRKCNVSRDDCAIFLENQRVSFESQGYTAAYPTGANVVIGYAYPNVHSDNDSLIDGQELLLGSRLNAVDSDQDGFCDDAEYPLAGLPVSDLCSEGRCTNFVVFADSFELRGQCNL